jgi:hypothetical protein
MTITQLCFADASSAIRACNALEVNGLVFKPAFCDDTVVVLHAIAEHKPLVFVAADNVSTHIDGSALTMVDATQARTVLTMLAKVNYQNVQDSACVKSISALLAQTESWPDDTMSRIANLVRSTGRYIPDIYA